MMIRTAAPAFLRRTPLLLNPQRAHWPCAYLWLLRRYWSFLQRAIDASTTVVRAFLCCAGIKLEWQLQQKKRQYSVTDAKAVGKMIIEHQSDKCQVKDILGQVLSGGLPPVIDEDFKKQWANAEEEKDLQVSGSTGWECWNSTRI